MLELRLFRNPALCGASIGALTISASILSVLLYITLYLQDVLRYSAFQTGVRFLPLTIPIIVAAPVAGRLSSVVPQRLLIGGGLGLVAIGLALLTMVSATSGWMVLLAGMIVSGLGSGLTNPTLASAAVGTVSPDKAGIGSGINNTFRQIGIATGIAGLGAIFGSTVRTSFVHDIATRSPAIAKHASQIAGSITSGGMSGTRASGPGSAAVQSAVRAAFATGLDRICWVAAGIAAAGAVASAILLRPQGISSAPEASDQAEQSLRTAA